MRSRKARRCFSGRDNGELDVGRNYLELYGNWKVKVDCKILEDLEGKPDGKLILGTAITPASAGEGKTMTTVGLGDALT
ncbi:MAG: formate--tetrahydrofolate ligase [Clostridiales bacterium]|nr:formate--tetrahydrofolate ligase [Clostridiales bacterium]